MSRLIFIVTFFIGIQVQAQHIFPEKFEGCNEEMFAFESDTTISRIADEELINIVTRDLDSKVKKKIRGLLLLQILVDSTGKSCLLSIENKTNKSSSTFNLKNSIDNYLIWRLNSTMKISAMVVIKFSKNNIALIRLGIDGNRGWHAITDMPNKFISPTIEYENHNTKNKPRIVKDSNTNSVWKLFNTSNSMVPCNMSRAIDIDSNGIIWYCTDEGIVKIDNEIWTVFTAKNSSLPRNQSGRTSIHGLAVDKQNRVWVQTLGIVMMYDGNNWIKFDTSNSPLQFVQNITLARNGVLWFGTFKGLVKYDNGEWTHYTTQNSKIPSNNVRKVFLDNNNILWVATENGIAKFENTQWSVFDTQNSLLPSNSVAYVNGDKNGNIWIGTNEVNDKGGLIKIDTLNQWTVYSKSNSKLPSNTIWDIKIEDTIIWLANTDGGLVRFDGVNWEIYNHTNSIIPNNLVSSLAIDKKGNKWITTFDGLVYTTR
jgi:ligand-binding sensor domain-containing protein